MRSDDLPIPGLKRRANKNGPPRLYWCARADLVKAGYRPETVRLPYDETRDHALISAACLRFQAEMLEWSSGRGRELNRFDGTILTLSRRYQADEASPFNRRLKHTTRKNDLHTLKIIEAAFGSRAIASLTLNDFVRWYDAAKAPKVSADPSDPPKVPPKPRIRRAWGIIKKLREMFSYGVAAELAGCARVKAILAEARFAQPARRRITLDASHVALFLPKAIELGRLSLALATALQFDTMMRQKDIIGEWEPIPPGGNETGIVRDRKRWVSGLVWSDLVVDGVTRKITSKTGAIAAHDLSMCPNVQQIVALVPPEARMGPVIVDEATGLPYATTRFSKVWRKVARQAGIPDHVWNMDARAGAITEAEDAGADLDAIRATAAHSQASTTIRYSRGAVGKSRSVAELRLAHRSGQNKA